MDEGNENLIYSSPWDFKRSSTCRKILRHGTSGFTSHPKEGVLRIFIALKNTLPCPGSNPRPLDQLHTNHYTTKATELRGLVGLIWAENLTYHPWASRLWGAIYSLRTCKLPCLLNCHVPARQEVKQERHTGSVSKETFITAFAMVVSIVSRYFVGKQLHKLYWQNRNRFVRLRIEVLCTERPRNVLFGSESKSFTKWLIE
jgi:hypothetical protein